MEIIFRSIPLASSGHSEKRGKLSVGMLCMIPSHSFSKIAMIHYKNTVIGVVRNLTFNDLHNGVAELRGDIVFDRNYDLIAKMALDEVYPSISVSATYNDKAITIPYLGSLSLVNREEREFEEQQPLNLSDLRVLVNSATKSEAPAKPQGDGPYIYAPGMNNEDIAVWIRDIYSNLNKEIKEIAELQELKRNSRVIENLLDEREAFLSKTIRV
ncbi:hypothetical protein KCE64_005143 [Salmonella enterica subsp. enterica serovar Hvittingfoss]|nr:hypothetical protein [Salmonella enterica subsp. enterica serovar Hvittingfoss]EHL2852609.1 hypothetical protein [Salmonella enterica subsp. enterica serovar Hvittingfoss]